MTKRTVKCQQCQRVDASTIGPDGYCIDCRTAWKVYGWRRFAGAMLRGLEPEDRKPSMPWTTGGSGSR
jgi:hypothetical protein